MGETSMLSLQRRKTVQPTGLWRNGMQCREKVSTSRERGLFLALDRWYEEGLALVGAWRTSGIVRVDGGASGGGRAVDDRR